MLAYTDAKPGSQRQVPQAGAEAELMKEGCVLTPLTYSTWAHVPRNGATQSGLGPRTSISNQETLHRQPRQPI